MAVIKGQGLRISLAYHEHEPWLLSYVGHRRQDIPRHINKVLCMYVCICMNQMKLLAVEIPTYYTKIIKQEMCSSRKYPYSPHRRDWKFLGGGGIKI